jgi:uncharacterized protein (UPF0332 family)
MTYEDYARKAQKSLKAARVLFEIELYDSCVSRSYYAMFQMAVAVLMKLAIKPPREGTYSHSWVQAVVVQEIIRHRKRIARKFGNYLPLLLELRHEADYKGVEINRKNAERALKMATEFFIALRNT